MRDCSKCKFVEEDCIFDEETGDEYPIYFCDKGNDTELDFECEDYKEYKPKPYVEHDTECDSCKFVHECESAGYVLESTTRMDSRRHFIKGRGVWCKKRDGDLYEKNISEVISNAQKVHCIDGTLIPILEKALGKYGDVTLKEFFDRSLWEWCVE